MSRSGAEAAAGSADKENVPALQVPVGSGSGSGSGVCFNWFRVAPGKPRAGASYFPHRPIRSLSHFLYPRQVGLAAETPLSADPADPADPAAAVPPMHSCVPAALDAWLWHVAPELRCARVAS
jgi:hypothetical protein